MNTKYLSIVEKLNYAAFLAVMTLVPFPNRVERIAWVVWLITWALEGRFLRKENFTFNKSRIPFLLLLGWMAWESLSAFWAIDPSFVWIRVGKQFYFIALILIALFGVNKNYRLKPTLLTFVTSCIISFLVYLCIAKATFNNDLHIAFGEYYYDVQTNLKHRHHYCNILELAIIGIFPLMTDALKQKKLLSCALAAFAMGILLCAIVMSGSRTAILTVFLLASASLFLLFWQRSRSLTIIATALTIGLGTTALLNLHPRMRNVHIEDIKSLKPDAELTYAEPRLNIWRTALENVDTFFWKGIGTGNATEFLGKNFKEKEFPEYYYTRHWGTHNQYLNEWMSLGIFGLLYFCVMVFSFPFFFNGKAKKVAFLATVVWAANLFTDVMFCQIEGIMTFCIFCIILLIFQDRQGKITES